MGFSGYNEAVRAPIALLAVPLAIGCPAEDELTELTEAATGSATSAGLIAASSTSSSDAMPGTEGGPTPGGDATAGGVDSGVESTIGADMCVGEFPAVVTDIDGTLTLADAEFLMQVDDGNYDPRERFGAHQMLGAYADLGYRILYLTGRPESWTIEVTNETAREVTERWLEEHQFPNDPDQIEIVLAPRLLSGEAARAFKAQAIIDLQAEGWRFEYAYGNTSAEIGGYADAGIPKDVTFIIGSDGGMGGTTAVEGEDWSVHANAHIPTVPPACGAQ